MEFHFDPGEHSVQVSAKSIEESGCGVEWVNTVIILPVEDRPEFAMLVRRSVLIRPRKCNMLSSSSHV
jgi:hypothetical protein